MKKCITLGLFLFLIILISCQKYIYSDSIIGQWRWVKSTAGEHGSAVTAESYDTTHYIEFNTNGYYYLYDNSKRQINTSRYNLSSDDISSIFKLLDTSHPDYRFRYTIKEDTLSIKCKDCCPYCEIDWIPFYKRIN